MASRRTLVEHVRDSLLADLLAGRHAAGEQLPNEDELAGRFEVSRATVREAIRGLLEVGYLSRKHGRGTFVTGAPRHRHSLDTTVSYTAMIREAGMEPGEQVLSRGQRAATKEEAGRLGIDAGEALVVVERVRTADGVPAVYSVDRIPKALLGDLATAPLDTSLYALLAEAGLAVHHAAAVLRPVVADRRLSRLLGVPQRAPLQYIDQVDFTALGNVVMLSSEWHVPDVFELCVNRRPIASPTWSARVRPAGPADVS